MEFRTLIGVDSLQGLLAKPRVAVVDCRFDLMNPSAARGAYLAGHIPGARYADLNRDLSGSPDARTGRHPLPAPEAFARRLGEFGIGNATQVVAYDDAGGSFAARLWWMLRWVGHRAVAVLDGGLPAWTAHGGAVQPGSLDIPSKRFTPRIDPDAVLSSAEMERALESSAILLIDARSAERFAGRAEPIDPVAGHIPGAVNHPLTNNLGADGRFLPPALLRARWLECLGGRGADRIVAMCGSGVTACHNLLSLEIAGLAGGKLYAGSWSEWICDPKRPVARGA